MSNDSIDLVTRDGVPVEGRVISMSRGSYNSHLMGHLALLGRITGRAANSLYNDATFYNNYNRERVTIAPPIPLSYYISLYRNDPIQKACVDAKVACVTSQGYKIRPRREMALVDNSTATAYGEEDHDPDEQQKAAVIGLLDAGLPDYPLVQTLHELWLDVESTGNGYLELTRNGMGELDGIYPVKSATIEIVAGGDGYMQHRGGKARFFAKYTGEGGQAVALRAQKTSFTRPGKQGVPREMLSVPVEWGNTTTLMRSYNQAARQLMDEPADGDTAVTPVNEIMMFKKPTPLDTPYGEPDIVAAVYDALGSESAALFNLNYFENATIPRLVIIIEGGQMSSKVEEQIRSWVAEQSAPDVLNQVLLIENPDASTKIRIEPLGVSELRDAGFLEYREHCAAHIMTANRTPASIIGYASSDARSASVEANLRFFGTVVRPGQRLLESRFNYLFEQERGVKDWVLELAMPELVSPLERAQFFDTLISRGVVTVNDVRRFFGMHPVEGGDEPFIQVVGQGAVPIKFLDRIVEANMNTSGNPLIATSGMQTPSDDAPVANLPQEAQGRAGVHVDALRNLSPGDQNMTVMMMEQLGVDPKLVQKLPGGGVDSAVNKSI